MDLHILDKNANESVNDYAMRVLRHNILHLILEPGARISVVEISQKLNISRTPVQNAFTRLSEEAMLEIFPQSGTYVSMIDMKRVYESISLRILIDQTVLRRLCEIDVSSNDLYLLQTNLNQQEFYNDQDELIKSLELDTSFHEQLYRLCHMENVYSAMQMITVDQCRVRMLKLLCKLRSKTTGEEHLQMLNAIRNHDYEHSHEIASKHVEGFAIDLESVHEKYSNYFSNWDAYNPQKFKFGIKDFHVMM